MPVKLSDFNHENHKKGTRQGQVRGLLETLLPGEPKLVNIEGFNLKSIRVLVCNHANELGIKVATRTMQDTGYLAFYLVADQ